MTNKEFLNEYNRMQQDFLTDIDLSGSLFIEYQKLNKTNKNETITLPNNGTATVNNSRSNKCRGRSNRGANTTT